MQSQNATLVVIEFGASWPRWLSPTSADHMAVVAQHYEGTPASLIIQVANRLSRLVTTGWRIEDAILVSNGRSDGESLSARSELARGLLLHLREVSGARLLLSVAKELGERPEQALTALSRTLRDSARGSGIALGVRIGEAAPVYANGMLPRLAQAS
ncbi:MAG: hypothetical protein QM756_34350 [Polyangiaceae bacterium]